ncbi:hypothetical protein [Cohnella herbarum]|uniref:Uncharacterized protein n=1 Tax=Cohnella herbarum TaxID=2728023 RepID=A0A7Z2ZKD6_9BACL|nr:hypothetical protein [Cohnella herbarum]QJD82669.1 hypothetical protein HH215_05360 [Cohnella herbarum]
MRNIKFRTYVLAIATLMSVVIYFWSQTSKPITTQLNEVLAKKVPNFNQLLHVHKDNEKTLAFYTTTTTQGVYVASVSKRFYRYSAIEHVGFVVPYPDSGIAWSGIVQAQEKIHLLFGIVQDDEISRITIVSENNKQATVIDAGSEKIWYAFMEESLHSPVTFTAVNQEGNRVFEYGDLDYWNDLESRDNG